MKGNESAFINYHQDPVDNGEGNFPPQSRHIRMILYCLFSHNATNYSSLPTEWQHSDMMSLLTSAHDTFSSLTLWLSASCCTSLFKPPSLLCHSFIGKNNITYGFVIDTFSLDTCVHSPPRAEMEEALCEHSIARNVQRQKLQYRPNLAFNKKGDFSNVSNRVNRRQLTSAQSEWITFSLCHVKTTAKHRKIIEADSESCKLIFKQNSKK